MAISFSRCFVRYINDIPHSNPISDVQVIQVIRGQTSRTCGTSENYDFIWFDTNGSMSGAC